MAFREMAFGLTLFITAVAAHAATGPYQGTVKAIQNDNFFWYCAIDDADGLHCWGGDDLPKIPDGVKAQSVSLGAYICAIGLDSKVSCWGEGNSNDGTIFLPPQVQFAKSISINAQGDACAIALDGKAYCWTSEDQSTDDSYHDYTHVVNELPRFYSGYDDVEIHEGGACFVQKATGKTDCWDQDPGQWTVTAPATDVVKISMDDWGTGCALMKDGSLKCFGVDYDGNFNHDEGIQPIPAGLDQIRDVSLGRVNACAIGSDGMAQCWSFCTSSKCYSHGVSTPPQQKLIAIATGLENGCGITEDHRVVCWGTSSSKGALK